MTDYRGYFGTDGVRGIAGKLPMTPEFVLQLGWALGRVLRDRGAGRTVIIGKDARISGYVFEYALSSGLLSAGIDCHLLGVTPTPAIAYFTRAFQASAGVVISASHNEYCDNGVKIFAQGGIKLLDEDERQIEHYLNQPLQMADSSQLGKAHRIDGARERYIEFCKNSIPLGLPFSRLKVVLDCSNGATYAVAPHVFRELGAQVVVTNVEPDGFNINAGCGSTHPESLQRRVRELGADVGIAFDGDGDRTLLVDRNGDIVDGDKLLYTIAKYRAFKGEALRDVVGTIMTNLAIEQAFTRQGINFHRTKVGDRYVLEKMHQIGARVGGESSGHIICLDRNSTGDGIIASLQVLAGMLEMDAPLHELVKELQPYPQISGDIRVNERNGVLEREPVAAAVAEAEALLGERGRMVIRPSGTEPKIRIMAEGQEPVLLQRAVDLVVAAIRASE